MRKSLALVVVAWLMLVAAPAAAQGTFVYVQEEPEHAGPLTRAVHVAIGAHMIAQFADVSTTEYALGTGRFKEHNPLLKWASKDPIPMAIVKGGFAVATSYMLLRMHKKRPRLALVVALSMTAITTWAAHANAEAIRSDRR